MAVGVDEDDDGNSKNCSRSVLSSFLRPVLIPIVRADDRPPPGTVIPSLPFVAPSYDNVTGRRVQPPWQKLLDDETGWIRLKQMFNKDVYGVPGPEWSLIFNATYGGFASGVIIGSVDAGRKAKERFIIRNQATTFHNEMQARRALQDRITLGMFSGAMRGGLKVGAFTFLYVFSTTLLSVHRGRTSLLDFVAAGTFSGFLWRFSMGPKAALVSSVLGGILGIIAGGLSMLAFYVSGTSMEELRYWHYHALTEANKCKQISKEDAYEERSKEGTGAHLT